MASRSSPVCLACGGPAVAGDRRIIGEGQEEEITLLWKKIACKRLDEREGRLDLDAVLRTGPFMCRKCFRAYSNVLKELKKLESKMVSAISGFSVLQTSETVYQQPRKRASSATCNPPTKRSRVTPSSTLSEAQGHTRENTDYGSSASPNVSISIEYEAGVRKYNLTPSRKYVGKAVARRSKYALVKHALQDPGTKVYMVRTMGVMLKRELAKMCSDRVNSCLRDTSSTALEFNWDTLFAELTAHAPILLSLLLSCTATRRPRQNRNAVIGMCCALLLKFRFAKMCLIQKVVSLILYAGNCGKMVYTRLQKLNVSLSHNAVNGLVTTIGEEHDGKVKEWRDYFSAILQDTQELGVIPRQSTACTFSDEDCSSSSNDGSTSSSSSIYGSPLWSPVSISPISSGHEMCSDDDSVGLFHGGNLAPSGTPASSTLSQTPASPTTPLSVPQLPAVSTMPSSTLSLLPAPATKFFGYKIVGDNIDKGVKARYMRANKHQNQSLHYFNSFAVANRVDFSALSDVRPSTCLNSPQKRAVQLLPSKDDDAILRSNFMTLVSRVLVEFIPFFKETFDGVVTRHIQHEYSTEMSTKSQVVPLGVILKNENKGDEMVDILLHLQQYTPAVECKKEVVVGTGEPFELTDAVLQKILFGGDQLTAARIRGAQRARSNCLSSVSRLEGFEATAADFHVKLNLLDVGWKYFYSTTSAGEMGTMYQLRNLIGRTNVNAAPISRFNECDDFFTLVIKCHIVVAAMKLLQMNNLEEVPQLSGIDNPSDLWMESSEKRKEVLMSVCSDIVSKFISFQYTGTLQSSKDKVVDYGKRLLEFGAFYLEISDGIREGDGGRLKRCYRYLLPIFKSSDRRNYAIEVLNMLCQHEFELPPRQAAELIWSRFVCTHSSAGHNIPEDLHQEHLNRVLKDAIRGLGANKTEVGIVRAGKALGTLDPVLREFDAENSVKNPSGSHKPPSTGNDGQRIIQQLLNTDIFSENLLPVPRCHNSFPKPKDFLHSLDKKKLMEWMSNHIKS